MTETKGKEELLIIANLAEQAERYDGKDRNLDLKNLSVYNEVLSV